MKWQLREVIGTNAALLVACYGDDSFSVALGKAQLAAIEYERGRHFVFGVLSDEGKFAVSRNFE